MINSYQPRVILVTGGAGFIGANFIRYLLNQDSTIQIINIDKLTYAGSMMNLENLFSPERHHFVHGDITNELLISTLLRQHQIDTIVHFAAESHVDRSIASPNAFVETNIVGTFTLLQAARKYWLEELNLSQNDCRFHHVSTDEVYGTLALSDQPFTEKTTYSPRSPYSASKAASDHLVFSYYHTYDLPVTISNCSNNYGAYQHQEKFIPTIIRRCYDWQPIPIYGNGKNIRDWLYVDDHCRGIHTIMQQGQLGESYNIGGDNEWENLTLAKFICEAFDKIYPRSESHASLITFVKDRLGHDFRYAIDATKIKTLLNWQPHETFATGMQKTIEFYVQKFSNESENLAVSFSYPAHAGRA